MKIAEFKKDSIYKTLRGDILRGKYPFHFKFPKELDFAAELGIAKVTLRSALIKLESEGLIARLPARGTYVTYKTGSGNGRILILTTHMNQLESPSIYILPGILSRTAELGRETVLCEADYLSGLSSKEQKEFAIKNNISGIIMQSSNFNGNEPLLDIVKKMNLPTVLPHGWIHDRRTTGFAIVRNDFRGAWQDALNHLISKGHRNIGSIILHGSHIRTYSENEYLELLRHHQAKADKSMISYSSYSENDVEKAVHELFKKACAPPTAILCFSDFMAIHVYDALKKMKLRIPRDIAVMGYCGYPGSSLLSPPLSTIDFQYSKAGAAAVDLLLRAAEWFGPSARSAVPEIIMPHILCARESSNITRIEEILLTSEAV